MIFCSILGLIRIFLMFDRCYPMHNMDNRSLDSLQYTSKAKK